ncbi:hypothetical protein Vafri_7461 [Volvox africanus]|uniref:Patatin n=1 Tax=Volvox africanus TaxID=51714 RepID=A0A8J4EXS5_9CHLO|nr:hypothetical protein Vafri_7461 [Volvox africanus]
MQEAARGPSSYRGSMSLHRAALQGSLLGTTAIKRYRTYLNENLSLKYSISGPRVFWAAPHSGPCSSGRPWSTLSGLPPNFYTPLQSYDGATARSGTRSSIDDQGVSVEEKERRAQSRLEQVRRGLESGTLGFGFSAGGFLYPYHLGVLWELHELDILKDYKVQMAGASAGSLAVATYNCGLDPEKATQAMHAFADDCRSKGTRYRLGGLLRDFLHAYLPDDAHERCRGNTHIALTRLFPVVRSEMISEFESKDDFINALLTSCHIPFYFNGSWMTEFRGKFYMDGGVAAFIPRPPTEYAVKVCCFPVNEVLATVQDRVAQYERVASLLDVSISPDAYESWPFNYAKMVTWALVPADDDMLRYMINKGRRDARAWAQRMQLVPHDAAANLTGGEGAGEIGGGAERAAERVRQAQSQTEAAVAEGLRNDGDGTGARDGTGALSVAQVASGSTQGRVSRSGSERTG